MPEAPASDSAAPWKDRIVLVCGGLGFIVSNLARRLCDLGVVVTVLDCLLPQFGGKRFNLEGSAGRVRTHRLDLRAGSCLETLLEGQEVTFHLADQSRHLDSRRDPEKDLGIHVMAQLIYASTLQSYGRRRKLPVDERQPIQPVDRNGINKLVAEMVHLLCGQVYDFSAGVLRLIYFFGPRMRIRDARQTFLGIWVRQLIEGMPIEVWGGDQLRDLNDVEDVVDAILIAGLRADLPPEPCNLGLSEVIYLADLAGLMIELFGSGELVMTPFPEERKKIAIGDYHCSSARFEQATGWQPRRMLRQTLERTLAFYTSHLPHYV